MKKRLALLGLALLMVLGSIFGGAFAPVVANFVANATTTAHAADVANYSIENLPKKSHQVGDDVPQNQPRTSTGVYYTLTRQVSNRHIVVGVSHSTAGNAGDKTLIAGLGANHPGYGITRLIGVAGGYDKFRLEGSYTYNFYSEEEYRNLEFIYSPVGSTNSTGMVQGGTSFHSYSITVYSTSFEIKLPENDKDIFPNVIIPNNQITLPLPKSLTDLKGRDLLDLNHENTDAAEARREAYLPQLKAEYIAANTGNTSIIKAINGLTEKNLIKYLFDGATFASPLDAAQPVVTDAAIIDLIYRDMRISFFGNETRKDIKYDGTTNTTGIKNAADRKVTPTIDGGNYYAVYAYSNSFNDIEASYRTSNITVERPIYQTGITDATARDNILLNTIPEMSFTPSTGSTTNSSSGSFKIGEESTLPTATMTIHEDSKIKFDGTNTLTNYTYVAVRYREKTSSPNDRQWRWLGSAKDADGLAVILPDGTAENSSDIMRISDFKFTPERIGDYQFWYYTTTVFGIGLETDIPSTRIHTQSIDGENRKFIKTQPFDNITIERDNLAPEIKWTDDYEYKLIDGVKQPTIDNGATALKLEDAVDRSKMLPGSTTSSKTKIAKGDSLVIPALLGIDNATPSHELDYQLYLYRYQDGIRSDDCIIWRSGLNGEDENLNGKIWKHNETFHIPFTDASFNNGDTGNTSALLAAFRGFSVIGKYDIMVRAYDEENNISGQFQYTFEVVAPENWTASRPIGTGFRAGQNEYHEGDTLRFNVASFSDNYTDDRDIEVRYFLSLDEGKDIERLLNDTEGTKAVEIKDGENSMSISNGVASFELKEDNEAGAYILNELNFVWEPNDWYPTRIKNDPNSIELVAGATTTGGLHNGLVHDTIIGTSLHKGFLTFRVYAVARNYHAMTKITSKTSDPTTEVTGYEVGGVYNYGASTIDFSIDKISLPANSTNPTPPNYISAVFDMVTVFDTSYGAAAVITDKFGGEYTPATRATTGTPSWYPNDTVIRQDDEVAIPALRFFYPNGKGPLYSTITYSVTYEGHTGDARSYNTSNKPVGGGWQGMLGEIAANNQIPAIDSGDRTTNGRTLGTTVYENPTPAQTTAQRSASQRFFTPMGVGEHLITVKVTNAGGNISVFVGKITVVGTPQATSRLLNARTTAMRVGESEKMPTVEITIDGEKYVTGTVIEASDGESLLGYIVTQNIHPVLGRQARVGTFEIIFGSENGSEPAVSSNSFIPRAVDTYWFTYRVEISDNIEKYPVGHPYTVNCTTCYGTGQVSCTACGGDGNDGSGSCTTCDDDGFVECTEAGCEDGLITMAKTGSEPLHIINALDPAIRAGTADPIRREETWRISVEPIQGADINVKLDSKPYTDLAHNNGNALSDRVGSTNLGRINTYYDKAFTAASDAYVDFYDPTKANTYNFFTDMLDANAENQLLEMSDAQLLGGLEPFFPAGTTDTLSKVPDQWQYGKIYVPNYLPSLATSVSWLADDFKNKAEHYITVTKGATTLLDTRKDSSTATPDQIDHGFSEDGYVWFRPTGLLVAQYDQNAAGTKDLDWAMRNAINKADWEPVATSQNNFLKVDGEYVITYHVEYMGVTLTEPKTYRIAMGDTRQPRITLVDHTETQDKFSKTYKVGNKFEFDTGDLRITGTKNPDVFLFEDGMNSWLANSQRNDNFSITITANGSQVLIPKVTVKKANGTTEVTSEGVDDEHKYEILINEVDGTEQHSFYFNEPGTYYLTFNVTSKSGVKGTREYRLTVEDKTPKTGIAPETVWGTILIILSIGLFAGIIIYFVRTGQQTKFASAKTKTKKPAKEKESADGGVV